ncbi:MAG TPA: FAD-dependent oxidoreductase [Burkholderiaceae bacterium]|nr:FAD-dependent oxidoreductase [Burkholderiaceae bacterium]
MTTGTVVIVGGGQAGAWAARSLRDLGHAGPIVMVSEERHAPYERPPLSKEILLGTGSADELTIHSHEELAALHIDVRPGVRCTSLDREGRRVILEGGEQLVYDTLILATGGRARRLDLPGVDSPRVHTLRTLDDAHRLRAALTGEPGHVLVVGGGWIGLEVAASARALGAEVTVLEAADRLCARSVAPDVSAALLDLHREQGVSVRLETSLTALQDQDDRLRVTLSDGTQLECQHLIMAAGLVANDELAVQAGLQCANGVLVDRQCRSSDPHIYAAGDVAVMETSLAGRRMRLESWQNAQDQGMAVAQAIMGQDVDYCPVPMVWSQQYDQFIQISGHVHAGDQWTERRTSTGILRFYLDATGTVVAAIGMNAGRDFRFARQLVERKARVPAAVLADPGQPLNKVASTAITA